MIHLKRKLALLLFSISSFFILTGFTNASENIGTNTAANTTANVMADQPVINFLGDSITFGAGTTSQENTYASILGRTFHAKVNNYGISGTTLACNSVAPFTFRYTAMEQNADMIIVFGGTNDFCLDVPVGNVGDTTYTTFYGGLNILMSGLKNKYPNASIIFLTPIKRTYYIAWNAKNHVNATLEDYRNAIITMGQLYGIRVIDLYPVEELDFTKNVQYMPDGLHPSDAGQQRIAEYIFHNL